MICNSGGAGGADMTFENESISSNIEVIAWSFKGHKTNSKCRKILGKDELEEGWDHVLIANQSLKRNLYRLSSYVKDLLSRNWFQVKNSEAIFAIGTITGDFKVVNGGTGWAVQMAIDNNKRTYVFDQNKNMWFKFNYDNDKFEAYEGIPKLTETFAGIGTREINENGINAIKELLKTKK